MEFLTLDLLDENVQKHQITLQISDSVQIIIEDLEKTFAINFPGKIPCNITFQISRIGQIEIIEKQPSYLQFYSINNDDPSITCFVNNLLEIRILVCKDSINEATVLTLKRLM